MAKTVRVGTGGLGTSNYINYSPIPITSTTNSTNSQWWIGETPEVVPTATEVDDEGIPGYTLEGTFQDLHFVVPDIPLGDSPIEHVLRIVFDLDEGDTIEAIQITTKLGAVEFRSWGQKKNR